jgi:hypothetical protein
VCVGFGSTIKCPLTAGGLVDLVRFTATVSLAAVVATFPRRQADTGNAPYDLCSQVIPSARAILSPTTNAPAWNWGSSYATAPLN